MSSLTSQLSDLTSRHNNETVRIKAVLDDTQNVLTTHVTETKSKQKDMEKLMADYLVYMKKLEQRDGVISEELHVTHNTLQQHIQTIDNSVTALHRDTDVLGTNIKEITENLHTMDDENNNTKTSIYEEIKTSNNVVLDKVMYCIS